MSNVNVSIHSGVYASGYSPNNPAGWQVTYGLNAILPQVTSMSMSMSMSMSRYGKICSRKEAADEHNKLGDELMEELYWLHFEMIPLSPELYEYDKEQVIEKLKESFAMTDGLIKKAIYEESKKRRVPVYDRIKPKGRQNVKQEVPFYSQQDWKKRK